MKILLICLAAAACGVSTGALAQTATSEMLPIVVEADRLPSVLEFPDLAYPELAARKRETGTVHVALHIDAGGITSNFAIEHSSGSPRLDAFALELARATRFQPATRDGENIATSVVYPIRFELKSSKPGEIIRLASN